MTAVGKKPFVVKNRPGFVGNRLQFALIAEAFRCLEEGVATAEDIDEIARSTFGIRLGDFGPIRLADMGGLDTYVSILTYLTQTLGERFAVPALLRELADRGDVGVKRGQGVFSYAEGEGAALVSARDAALALRVSGQETSQ
jgi:3-hydroxybutyryl-CoA dehydrogenase